MSKLNFRLCPHNSSLHCYKKSETTKLTQGDTYIFAKFGRSRFYKWEIKEFLLTPMGKQHSAACRYIHTYLDPFNKRIGQHHT